MDGYRIFLSHKFERRDWDRIEAIASTIDGLTPHLDVFNPRKGIRHGREWREQLVAGLRSADLLLIVYNDPAQDWSWCTYEAGLFSQLDEDDDVIEPIVCLHHPDAAPPSQLDHLQAVRAEPVTVARFLSDLLTTTEITRARWPLAAHLTHEELAGAAETICRQFQRVDTYYAVYRLELFIDGSVEGSVGEGIPLDARIGDATPGIFELFGAPFGEVETWGQLIAPMVQTERPAWLVELDRAFLRAADRKPPGAVGATMDAARGTRFVRPDVYSVDRYDEKVSRVVLVFDETLAPAQIGGRVFRMLRSMERTRTELIRAHIDDSEPTDLRLREDDLSLVAQSIEPIEKENRQQRVFARETIQQLFAGTDAERILAAGRGWEAAQARLLDAVEKEHRRHVLESLVELGEINHEVTQILAARYVEVVAARHPPRVIDLRAEERTTPVS